MKLISLPLFACISAALVNSAAAQPVVTPDLPMMNLEDVGVYSVGYVYRGKTKHLFPLGWSCEPFGTQNGQRAFLLHS